MAHLEANNKAQKQTCLVFDDLQAQLTTSKWASALATGGVHHLNLSVYTLLQQVFVNRTQRLQTDWLVLFAFESDKTAVMSLARQLMPQNPNLIMGMYAQAPARDYLSMPLIMKLSFAHSNVAAVEGA